jgi:hypothetical protein
MRRIFVIAFSVLVSLANVLPVLASGDSGRGGGHNHNETFLRDED